MVPADHENQLFQHVADFCWQNDSAFWIRNVRIDNVPKYLTYLLLPSPLSYPHNVNFETRLRRVETLILDDWNKTVTNNVIF